VSVQRERAAALCAHLAGALMATGGVADLAGGRARGTWLRGERGVGRGYRFECGAG
jgi:hypothetical protein